MKIAAVSMVKNECDIIELFIRLNARLIDRFFIVDNGSSDTTPVIIDHLRREGLPIEITTDPTVGYPQERITTRLIRQVAAREEFDWIMPLDADEFIQSDAEGLRSVLKMLPPRHCGKLQWDTFVPIREPVLASGNYLWSDFRQRDPESRCYDKVIVPSALAREGKIAQGNHHFMNRFGKGASVTRVPVRIAHVPLRNVAQVVCKSIIGSHQMSVKRNRHPLASYQWDEVAQRVRESCYRVEFTEVQRLAFAYALQPQDTVPMNVLPDSRIGDPTVTIRYPELAKISIEGRFDAYMANLCAEVRRLQRATRWFPFVK